ncbi:MAG TPA: 16S rRNA (adenine(1518)-N(6)/adenine(1519)-N(6))-dimethyltransferase [Lachnospiraceae bacterium]|nr:16S rRNA (adenine(1518)-N(6)/adenine(1519)-N(6))-dimethyltransferase [Lachnospiraceae bacterium]
MGIERNATAPRLSNPKTTREVIARYDFDFRKRFGQNFLIDDSIIRRSLEAAQVSKQDVIFEIGPGIGTLTQYLSEAAHQVVSIEIDKKLIPILEETLQGYDNVSIINEDVLKVDLTALAAKYQAGRTVQTAFTLKIVANLPYYITTPILMNLFRKNVPAQSITVMVQKEVADRMCAKPGSKDYGSLSVAVQYYSAPRIVELVPPSSFMPQPKVTSAIVTMNLYEEPPVKAQDEVLFDAIVRAAFEQRRKTLVNALSSGAAVPFGKEQVTQVLSLLGLSPSIRGEKLSISDFVQLSDRLSEMKHTQSLL